MPNAPSQGPYWTYVVRCKYGTYYAGYTDNLKRRMALHNSGQGAKYLRGRGPVQVVYMKKFLSKSRAMAHERWIKNLNRKQKDMLTITTPGVVMVNEYE